jgi:hypothetical protein
VFQFCNFAEAGVSPIVLIVRVELMCGSVVFMPSCLPISGLLWGQRGIGQSGVGAADRNTDEPTITCCDGRGCGVSIDSGRFGALSHSTRP